MYNNTKGTFNSKKSSNATNNSFCSCRFLIVDLDATGIHLAISIVILNDFLVATVDYNNTQSTASYQENQTVYMLI